MEKNESEKKQRLNSCAGSASLKRLRCLTSVVGWASTWVKLCKCIKNSWQLIHLQVGNSIQICLLKVLLAPGVAHQLRMRTAPRVWQSHFRRMDIFDLLYSNNYSNNLLNIHISITNQSKSFQNVFGFARATTSWSPQEHMSHHCPVENYLMKTPGQIWFGGQGFSLG